MTLTSVPRRAAAPSSAARVSNWLGHPDVLGVITLMIAIFFFAIFADGFFSTGNLRSIVITMAVYACMALGENLVILAGEIDVSVGSILALSGFAAGGLATATSNLWIVLGVALGVGLLAGLLNGLVVAYTRVPSIVVTLGTLYVYQGVALLISHSRNISSIPDSTAVLGSGDTWNIPHAALVVIVAFLILFVVRRNTSWGRDLLATGGNRQAAGTMGVPVRRQLLIVFSLAGLLAGLASVVYLGQLGGMQTSVTQTNTVLQVIAACAIGGTAITGGRGTDLAPITGALLIGVITSGLVILGVPSVWISCAYGACILVAVARDRFGFGKRKAGPG